MVLGIDIYQRYQSVNDWAAVKRHGVSFVYVKGTDGTGPARVLADAYVRGAQSVELPVGLYHYAQLGDPRVQARVLAREVRRLGATDLPPALDLEDPHKQGEIAREFAVDFFHELRKLGFPRVCLYASTSMLAGIEVPRTFDNDDNVVIWAARYGVNDGRNHGVGGYRGRVTIHQFTSVGQVPGIHGTVDLNDAADLEWIGGQEKDMALVPEDAAPLMAGSFFHADRWRTVGETIGTTADLTVENVALGRAILAAVTSDGDLSEDRIRALFREVWDQRSAELLAAVRAAVLETTAGEQAEALLDAISRRLDRQNGETDAE